MPYVEVSDEDYLRVLFPRRGVGRERLVEAAICTGLVIAREEVARSRPTGRGPVEVSVDPGQDVRPVRASVCIRCPWVAWEPNGHERCLEDGDLQEPDVGTFVGPMVVDLGVTSDDDRSGAAAYQDALYPPTVARSWGRFMRRTSGARIARRLWDQRQALAAARVPDDVAAQHVGVVLDAVPEIAHAACLTCTWIGTEGTSMTVAGWRDLVLEDARRHETTSNGPV